MQYKLTGYQTSQITANDSWINSKSSAAGMYIIAITDSELWAVIDYPLMMVLYYETICN